MASWCCVRHEMQLSCVDSSHDSIALLFPVWLSWVWLTRSIAILADCPQRQFSEQTLLPIRNMLLQNQTSFPSTSNFFFVFILQHHLLLPHLGYTQLLIGKFSSSKMHFQSLLLISLLHVTTALSLPPIVIQRSPPGTLTTDNTCGIIEAGAGKGCTCNPALTGGGACCSPFVSICRRHEFKDAC